MRLVAQRGPGLPRWRAHGETEREQPQRERPPQASAARGYSQGALSVLQCLPSATFVERLALVRMLVGQRPESFGNLLFGQRVALIRHWGAPNERPGNQPVRRSAARASKCVRS